MSFRAPIVEAAGDAVGQYPETPRQRDVDTESLTGASTWSICAVAVG